MTAIEPRDGSRSTILLSSGARVPASRAGSAQIEIRSGILTTAMTKRMLLMLAAVIAFIAIIGGFKFFQIKTAMAQSYSRRPRR